MALSFIIPQPEGMKFTQWTALVAEQLAAYGVGAATDDETWKTWVCALFYIPELVAKNVPTPDQYSEWPAWADLFIESVR